METSSSPHRTASSTSTPDKGLKLVLVNGRMELVPKDGGAPPRIAARPPAAAPQARPAPAAPTIARNKNGRPRVWPLSVRGPFTRSERIVMEAIVGREIATYDQIASDLYAWDPHGGPGGPKAALAMMVARLRRKLRTRNVFIMNVWGIGYGVNAENRVALRVLLETTRSGALIDAADSPPG